MPLPPLLLLIIIIASYPDASHSFSATAPGRGTRRATSSSWRRRRDRRHHHHLLYHRRGCGSFGFGHPRRKGPRPLRAFDDDGNGGGRKRTRTRPAAPFHGQQHQQQQHQRGGVDFAFGVGSSTPASSPSFSWYPRTISNDSDEGDDDDIYGSFRRNGDADEDGGDGDAEASVEVRAVKLAASLVRRRLYGDMEEEDEEKENREGSSNSHGMSSSSGGADSKCIDRSGGEFAVPEQARGRFMDLACDVAGERALESLFCCADAVGANDDDDALRGAVMAIQSLCAMGTCVGLKGPPEVLKRMVSHLDPRGGDPALARRDLLEVWDGDSVRRLKYRLDRAPALQLLSELKWKRTPQGAYDLLVALGAWKKHEDLALLRSGFPLRFAESELAAARRVAESAETVVDVDDLMGIRRDMRDMKVYTIDSASTSEIDDGLSIEVVEGEGGEGTRNRIWICIADVDRWADEDLFEVARKRVTSLYLPGSSYGMFPSTVSTDVMSLRANRDACALSLGVMLNDDGSVDRDSVVVVPSKVRVSYRLTYDEVDEMLEEGTGYREEWQLGALLDAAKKRRAYRVGNGSTEGLVPNPIPYATVSTYPDRCSPDGIGISHSVQISHNAGKNQTEVVGIDAEDDVSETSASSSGSTVAPAPLSSAYLLVTEMMILAGEAVGHWKRRMEDEEFQVVNGSTDAAGGTRWPNQVRLPFRTQPKPGPFHWFAAK